MVMYSLSRSQIWVSFSCLLFFFWVNHYPTAILASIFTLQAAILLEFANIVLYAIFGDITNSCCNLLPCCCGVRFQVVKYRLWGRGKMLLSSILAFWVVNSSFWVMQGGTLTVFTQLNKFFFCHHLNSLLLCKCTLFSELICIFYKKTIYFLHTLKSLLFWEKLTWICYSCYSVTVLKQLIQKSKLNSIFIYIYKYRSIFHTEMAYFLTVTL